MKTILLSPKGSLWLRYIFFVLFLLTFLSPGNVFAQDVKEEWVQRYVGSVPSQESTVKLATDNAGNTYVAGNAFSTSLGHHIVTAKYSSTGEELWTRRYSNVTAQSNSVSDIAVDSAGNVYVAGGMFSESAERSVVLVIKYSSQNGELLWTFTKSEGRGTFARKIELDTEGNGFITSLTNSFVPPRLLTTLTKFDTATGRAIWSESLYEWDNPEVEYFFRSFVLDSLGDVYITGTKGNTELITHKISSSDGEILWTKSIIGGQLNEGIAIDNNGGVYVIGNSRTSDGIRQEFLVKYQADSGAQLWYQNLTDGEAITGIKNLQADASGGVYLSGTIDGNDHIVRVDAADGTIDWSAPFDGKIAAMALDGKGTLFASGTGTAADYIIRKYLVSSGQLEWTVPDNDAIKDTLIALSVSSTGAVQVAGISTMPDGLTKMFVASHDGDRGELLWKTRLAGTTPASDIAQGVVTDKDGNVYVTGVGGPPYSFTRDGKTEVITIKYSPAGEELWARRYTLGNRFGESSESEIVLDNANGVYVSFGRAFLTIKYDALTGEQLWVDDYNEDIARLESKAITVDDAGGYT